MHSASLYDTTGQTWNEAFLHFVLLGMSACAFLHQLLIRLKSSCTGQPFFPQFLFLLSSACQGFGSPFFELSVCVFFFQFRSCYFFFPCLPVFSALSFSEREFSFFLHLGHVHLMGNNCGWVPHESTNLRHSPTNLFCNIRCAFRRYVQKVGLLHEARHSIRFYTTVSNLGRKQKAFFSSTTSVGVPLMRKTRRSARHDFLVWMRRSVIIVRHHGLLHCVGFGVAVVAGAEHTLLFFFWKRQAVFLFFHEQNRLSWGGSLL